MEKQMRRLLLALALLPAVALADGNTFYSVSSRYATPGGAPTIGTTLQISTAAGGTGGAVEVGFDCPASKTISKLCFYYSTRTGTVPRYEISLQGQDTSGNPDGTVKGAGNNVLSVFDPPDDATWNGTTKCTGDSGVTALTASYACTAGEHLTIVLQDDPNTADSIDASNAGTFGVGSSNLPQATVYSISKANSTGTRTRAASASALWFIDSDGVAYLSPHNTGTFTTYSDATNPDEHGMHVKIPCTAVSTFSIGEVFWTGRTPAAAQDSVTVNLFDNAAGSETGGVGGAGDLIDQGVKDADQWAVAGTTAKSFAEMPTRPLLNCGSDYYVGIRSGTSTAISIVDLTVRDVSHMTAYPGGTEFYLVTRNNGGAFTVSATTTRPFIDLMFSAWNLPTTSTPLSTSFQKGFQP